MRRSSITLAATWLLVGLACGPAASDPNARGESETGADAGTSEGTETGEPNLCGECQPAADSCQPDDGATASGSLMAEPTSGGGDDWEFEGWDCVLDSIEAANSAVDLHATCFNGPVVVSFSGKPGLVAPAIEPGTLLNIFGGYENGGGSYPSTWWWRVELAESESLVASYRRATGPGQMSFFDGVCEGQCEDGELRERVGNTAWIGDESVLVFDGQRGEIGTTSIWFTGTQWTSCETGAISGQTWVELWVDSQP